MAPPAFVILTMIIFLHRIMQRLFLCLIALAILFLHLGRLGADARVRLRLPVNAVDGTRDR
jgi:hypothetical protein